MKVSVALATYNGARYLREQLNSIASQSSPPAELIICDDGSSDDTVEIARRFAAAAPFKVVVDAHGERLGYTRNFVRAILQCTGDIVALCDQDDVWYEGKLAAAAPEFADESVMTVTHRIQVVDERLQPIPLVMPDPSIRGRYTLFNLDPWFSPNGMQMLFRRARLAPWLHETPPLSAYGFGAAPFDEWIFYLGTLAGTAVVMNEILGVWRRHDTATSSNLRLVTRDNSAAQKLHLALHSGAEAYRFRAEVNDTRADFAARFVPSADGTPAAAIEGVAEFYRGMARMFSRRVRLYDPASNLLRRLRTFGNMLARSDYRNRHHGGLGAKAALKDLFTVSFGSRRSVESTNARTIVQ